MTPDPRSRRPRNQTATKQVKLPFAARKDGRLVHVSEVPSGLACECACPECGTPVSAYKGEKNAHHFHHDRNQERVCLNALETTLHRMAKQIIDDNRLVRLPPVIAKHETKSRRIAEAVDLTLDQVTLEQWLAGIRPDIIAHKRDTALLIEIAVTHQCEPEKVAFIRKRELATIEIDLSRIPSDIDLPTLVDQVLYSADRVWIFNRHQEREEAAMRVAAQKALAKAIEDAEAARERKLAAMQAAHDAPYPPMTDPAKMEALQHEQRTKLAGFLDQTGFAFGTGGCFAVPWRTWQCMIIDKYAIGSSTTDNFDWTHFDTRTVLTTMKVSGYIKKGFERFIDVGSVAQMRAEFPGFSAPYEVVEQYLDRLAHAGKLRKVGHRWARNAVLAKTARKRIGNAARAAQDRKSVRSAVDWILKAAAPSVPFDLDRWWDRPLPGQSQSPMDIINSGEGIRAFIEQLQELERSTRKDGPVPDDLLGLPLEMCRAARIKEHREADERRAREREASRVAAEQKAEAARAAAAEAERSEGLARRARVQVLAETSFGPVGGNEYLSKPRQFLGGRAISNLMRLSHEEEAAIEQAIKWDLFTQAPQRQAEAAASANRAHLNKAALDAYRRRGGRDPSAEAELFLNTSHPKLGGRRPIDACADGVSLNLCLSLLPSPRSGGRRS